MPERISEGGERVRIPTGRPQPYSYRLGSVLVRERYLTMTQALDLLAADAPGRFPHLDYDHRHQWHRDRHGQNGMAARDVQDLIVAAVILAECEDTDGNRWLSFTQAGQVEQTVLLWPR